MVSIDAYGGELDQAASLEKAGHAAQALSLYRKWLDANPPSAAWDKTLLHSVDLEGDPQRAVADLLEALPKLSSDPAKHEAYVKIAQLDELLGNWSSAQESFQNASLVPGPKDYRSLLESARLLVQLGQLAKADAQARAIVATCQDPSVVTDAQALLVKIEAVDGKAESAVSRLRQLLGGPMVAELSPQSFGDLYEACVRLGLTSERAAVLRLLQQYYPGSPETSVVNGKISSLPTPAGLLGFNRGPYEGAAAAAPGTTVEAKPATPAGSPSPGGAGTIDIQIGSYLDPTNAEYRLQDLKAAGFPASVVKATIDGKSYYRVVVPNVPIAESQNYLVRLKEQGFEGFLLYD